MSFETFARNELRLINHPNTEEILELANLVGEGHSGYSIHFAINAIEREDYTMDLIHIKERLQTLSKEGRDTLVKLLSWLPLSELTLEDDEWEYDDFIGYQNKRLSKLFKDDDGKLSLISRVVFRNQHNSTFGCGFFRRIEDGELVRYTIRPKQFKEFPVIFINCLEYETNKDNYEHFVSKSELQKIEEVYDLEMTILKNS